jgi:hypothetical protein
LIGAHGPASSYLSYSDPRLHFGLGGDEMVMGIEIRWPSGAVERYANVAADRYLTVVESEGIR